MTQEQRSRVSRARKDTQGLLDQQLGYSPDLQKPDRIAFYRRHIAKMDAALETDTMPSFAHS